MRKTEDEQTSAKIGRSRKKRITTMRFLQGALPSRIWCEWNYGRHGKTLRELLSYRPRRYERHPFGDRRRNFGVARGAGIAGAVMQGSMLMPQCAAGDLVVGMNMASHVSMTHGRLKMEMSGMSRAKMLC